MTNLAFIRTEHDGPSVLRVAPALKHGKVIALFDRRFSMPEVLYPQPPTRHTARHPHFSGSALADELDGAIRLHWWMMHAARKGRDNASESPWQFRTDWCDSHTADFLRQWKSPRQMYAQRAKRERALLLELLELRRAALRTRKAA